MRGENDVKALGEVEGKNISLDKAANLCGPGLFGEAAGFGEGRGREIEAHDFARAQSRQADGVLAEMVFQVEDALACQVAKGFALNGIDN